MIIQAAHVEVELLREIVADAPETKLPGVNSLQHDVQTRIRSSSRRAIIGVKRC